MNRDVLRLLFDALDRQDIATFRALASTCRLARAIAKEISGKTYEQYCKWLDQQMFELYDDHIRNNGCLL